MITNLHHGKSMTNKNYLTTAEIAKYIQKSFTPYRCVVEFWDYYEKVRFRVYDKNNTPIITVPEIEVHGSDINELESLIFPYKEKVKSKGFSLD